MIDIQMNKFEVIDAPGMRTLAFLVEESKSEIVNGETYYSLQKLDSISVERDGKLVKEFSVIPDSDGKHDIVLLTLTTNKVIISTGLLDNKGFTPTEDKLSLSYGSLYNDTKVEYKEFSYTPNMKRRFVIIDTVTCEEVKPVVHIDEITKELKGVCKLLPLRAYIVLEIKADYNRGAVVATDGKRIEAMSHGVIKIPDVEINENDIEIDLLDGEQMIV